MHRNLYCSSDNYLISPPLEVFVAVERDAVGDMYVTVVVGKLTLGILGFTL